MNTRSASALLLAVLAGFAAHGPIAAAPPQRTASMCRSGEAVLYTCQFGRSVGSVCAGQDEVHYRFGLPGSPAVDVGNAQDWHNIHLGTVIGQGGGHQTHVRFTTGLIHYTVFAGENGSLADPPGRTYSGIAVTQGKQGETQLAALECKGGATIAGDWTGRVRAAVPRHYQDGLDEAPGGPFDAWF